jgi:cellulose synthase/poly-beta-1,6-N-acetylglucosamine synthase-like glycosyltransferase
MLDWLGSAFTALTIAGCCVLALSIAAHFYLIGLHLRLRKKGLAAEARMLAVPLPDESRRPHVVVQIPSYNEGRIISRAIKSAAALDWPNDKLHIQVCDDSTDGTTAIACEAIGPLAASGIDIALVRRPDRSHFKAGSLRAAMAQSPHDYFAIFDVDYQPPPNFLRRCMAVLIADPQFAFVQARTDFLNAGESWLTRAQAAGLDAHYAEQATRTWAGHPLPFNGTGGIWRRAAIEAGGGWQGETLAEDMELTYRAWLAGWRGVFLTSVTVPSELPANLKAWTTQQRRWTTGSGQVVRILLPAILRDKRVAPVARAVALLQLSLQAEGLIYALTLCAAALAALCRSSHIVFIGTLLLAVMAAEALVILLNQWTGKILFRPKQPLPRFLMNFGGTVLLTAYPIWVNIRYFGWLLPGRKTVFERTPKKGSP